MSENIECHNNEEARSNFKRQNAKDRCLILTRATDGENRLEMTTPCIGRMFRWCIKDDISASRKKLPNIPSFSYRRQTFNYKTKAGQNKGNEDTLFCLNIPCSHIKCLWSEIYLIRKSFQNDEEWRLFYCDSTLGCRVIQEFDLCKLDDLWRHIVDTSK